MNTQFEGTTVGVLGLARSGLACAEVLTELGATVRLFDSKPAEELVEAIAQAHELGIRPEVGGAAVPYGQLDYLITSPGVRKDALVLQEAVKAGVPVLSEIEAAYRIAQAPILAITGTNGKTTTAAMLGEMLQAAGIETYIAGNIAAGDLAMPLIKAAYLASPEAAIVAEISSFQLEWISSFRPKVAALLNITPDHGDRQTWEEYVAAKWRIFENQTPEDTAVLSESLVMNSAYSDILGNIKARMWDFAGRPDTDSVYQYGDSIYIDNADNPTIIDYSQPAPGGFANVRPLEKVCHIAEIKLPGQHNIENICAAAAMATAFGVGVEPIRQVATTFAGVVHRLEYVDTIKGVRYVNNSMCTNVAAFEKSLEALPEPKVVIAGGVFKGDDLTPVAQAIVKNNVRALILIGKSAPEIEAAARAAGYEDVYRGGSLADAVEKAASLARAGDTVLLAPACASFDMFQDFEDRGNKFKNAVHSLESP